MWKVFFTAGLAIFVLIFAFDGIEKDMKKDENAKLIDRIHKFLNQNRT